MAARNGPEIVRTAFLALNNGDEETFLDALDERVEWRSATTGLVPHDVLHGREAVRRGRLEADSGGRHVRTTLQEIRHAGEDVLVLGAVTAETPHRGRVTLPMGWIWTVRDARAIAVESFATQQAAVKEWERRQR